MKVLFLKDNLPSAMAGEIKDVKPGFARNYLIPKGIAERANKSSIVRVEKLRKEAEVRRADMKTKWQGVSELINNLNLEIIAQTGPTGKLFGSVTNSQIASSLEENLDGVAIDRRSIRISEPIKMIGSYEVPIKLFEGVETQVKILVKSDGNVMSEELLEISEGKVEESKEEDAQEEDAHGLDVKSEENKISAPEEKISKEE
ncbi:MAG: 50S ribosomal protein L9 [Chloroflexi bacterium]|nr:50S ribosomal protein L9 [Chloroflexota bacterium]|tara:strand:+ start:1466 stop:2071 length:606 start_codon:yes stop_codon:yes gene_type:complete